MKAPSEGTYFKSTLCDFVLVVNSNRGRITYRLLVIIAYRNWESPYLPTVF